MSSNRFADSGHNSLLEYVSVSLLNNHTPNEADEPLSVFGIISLEDDL